MDDNCHIPDLVQALRTLFVNTNQHADLLCVQVLQSTKMSPFISKASNTFIQNFQEGI